ncbi:MAG: hypothetical protein GX286_04650 [Clostridiales bacterium]|nr:hypothetical protein [Clostridiales bacterium]
MKRLNKFIAVAMSVTVLMTSFGGLQNVNATGYSTTPFGEGLVVEDVSEFDALAQKFSTSPKSQNSTYPTSTSLPSRVDLSESPCFPPIGNQGGIGSCTAWATTYYQYSFAVNKLNNVQNTSDRVLYSPAWTYNLRNAGNVNYGIGFTDAYNVLMAQGCLTLDEMPYSLSNYNPNYIPNNTSAMRKALETRVSDYGYYSISTYGTVITSNTDSDLTAIKTALNNGQVLTIATWNEFNYKYGTGNWSNTKLVYRCYDDDYSSHAMAVVGYDDNVTCDINGNGIIEAGERGAFKVVNSWGETDYGANNNGVLWIMYDALNRVSANGLNESQFSYTREPVFMSGIFHYISVSKKDVNLVAEVDITTNYKNQFNLSLIRDLTEINVLPSNVGYERSYAPIDATLVFDFGELADPISDYYTGHSWRIAAGDTLRDGNYTYFHLYITDNLGNVISDMADYNVDGNAYVPTSFMNLQKGDINFDRVIDSVDRQYIKDAFFGEITLSNLQFYLADMNDDGVINSFDLTLITRIINQ